MKNGNTSSILLVDIIEIQSNFLRFFVENHDSIKVFTAETGTEAVSLITENDFSVILIDYNFPEKDKIDSILRLKKSENKNNPFLIFISDKAVKDSEIIECFDAGAADFITRPINPEILAKKINIFSGLNLEASKTLDKQAEEIEKKYKSFFNLCSLVMLIVDPENGKIIDCNNLASSFYGYSIEELKNMTIFEINTLEKSEMQKVLGSIKNNKAYKFEFLHRLRDKQIRDVEVFSSPININSKIYLFSIILDITERKRLQSELIASEEKYRLAHEYSGLIIGYFKTDGTIISLNHLAAEGMKGKPEDFTGKSIYEVFPKDCADLFFERIKHASFTGEKFANEDFIKLPSGDKYFSSITKRISDSNDNIIGVQVISQDITEKKRLENELKESEVRFREIFRNSPFGIFQSTEKGRVIYINQTYAEIFGFESPEDFINAARGKNAAEITYENPEKRQLIIEETYKSGGWKSYENLYKRKGGEIFTGHLLIRSIGRNRDNELVFEGFVEDISERKKLENEKVTLLKEIHHRVKNNMQIIASLLGLQKGNAFGKNLDDIIDMSMTRIKSMALVHEKLYQSEWLSEINVKHYIMDLFLFLVSNFYIGNEEIAYEITVNDSIFLDIDVMIPLGLIINELVTNSLKYAFKNQKECLIFIRLIKKESKFMLEYSDNGCGLTKIPDLKDIKTFGLNLINNLVMQLGGELKIKCEYGTQFYINFEIKNK